MQQHPEFTPLDLSHYSESIRLDPTSAQRTCSSPGDTSSDRPTAAQLLLPLGALTTHAEASDPDDRSRTPRCRPRHTAITSAAGAPQHFPRTWAGE